jgi:hypothetical protein
MMPKVAQQTLVLFHRPVAKHSSRPADLGRSAEKFLGADELSYLYRRRPRLHNSERSSCRFVSIADRSSAQPFGDFDRSLAAEIACLDDINPATGVCDVFVCCRELLTSVVAFGTN